MTSISSERVTELPYRVRAVFTAVAAADSRVVTIDTRLRCQGIRFENLTPGTFFVTTEARARFTVPPGVSSFNFPAGVFTVHIDPQDATVGGVAAIGDLLIDFSDETLSEDAPEQELAFPLTQAKFASAHDEVAAIGGGMSFTQLASPPVSVPPGMFRVRVFGVYIGVATAFEAGGVSLIEATVQVASADLSVVIARVSLLDRNTAAAQRSQQFGSCGWLNFDPVGVPIPPLNALEMGVDGIQVSGVAPTLWRVIGDVSVLTRIERTPTSEIP